MHQSAGVIPNQGAGLMSDPSGSVAGWQPGGAGQLRGRIGVRERPWAAAHLDHQSSVEAVLDYLPRCRPGRPAATHPHHQGEEERRGGLPDHLRRLRDGLAAGPAEFVRGHWGIENRLHWVRDVTFDEDHSQVRTGNSPQIMASLRNAAITLLRLAGYSNIAAALHEHAYRPSVTSRWLMTC